MRTVSWRLCVSLLIGALLVPTSASAVWVCHLPDGRSWQQEWPPCKKPDDFDQLHPPPKRREAPSAKRSVDQQPQQFVQSSVPADTRSPYDKAVAELEAQYPELNPDQPNFNRDLTRRVMDRHAAHVKSGLQKDYALRAAVQEVMAPIYQARQTGQTVANQRPQEASTWRPSSDLVNEVSTIAAMILGIFLLFRIAVGLYRKAAPKLVTTAIQGTQATMGLFSDFKKSLDESPGRILCQQLADTQQKMSKLPEAVCAAALLGFYSKRDSLIGTLDNMTAEGRLKMAKTLQSEARAKLDFNISEGYALWLTGAWLETIDRPGIDAAKVHEFLDRIALESGGKHY